MEAQQTAVGYIIDGHNFEPHVLGGRGPSENNPNAHNLGNKAHLVLTLSLGTDDEIAIGKALCGAVPGKRSMGWFRVGYSTRCEKCLKRKNERLGLSKPPTLLHKRSN